MVLEMTRLLLGPKRTRLVFLIDRRLWSKLALLLTSKSDTISCCERKLPESNTSVRRVRRRAQLA